MSASGGPIKAGDLVVVTWGQPCCGDTVGLGDIYRVQSIERMNGESYCGKCFNHIGTNLSVAWRERNATGGFGYSVPRLTRIDPLPESETQDNQDEVTA